MHNRGEEQSGAGGDKCQELFVSSKNEGKGLQDGETCCDVWTRIGKAEIVWTCAEEG